jgi:hypothetical protein
MNYFSETLKKKMKQQYSYKASRQTGRQPQCQHFTLINSTISRKNKKEKLRKQEGKSGSGGLFFHF